jgi:hypothetical protein
MEIAVAFGYTLVALIFLIPVGNELCRWLLNFTNMKAPQAPDNAQDARAGRWIGTLERLILALGIIAQSWEAFAAVVALKTVARFSDLDKRAFAEYFLVGSLFSIFWTMLVTFGWLTIDQRLGLDLKGAIVDILFVQKP